MTSTDPAVEAADRVIRLRPLASRVVAVTAAREALAPIRELVEKWLKPTQPGLISNGAPAANTHNAAAFISELDKLIYTSEELENPR